MKAQIGGNVRYTHWVDNERTAGCTHDYKASLKADRIRLTNSLNPLGLAFSCCRCSPKAMTGGLQLVTARTKHHAESPAQGSRLL